MMKIKILTIITMIVFLGLNTMAQLSITNGNNILQIDGDMTTVYDVRLLKPGKQT